MYTKSLSDLASAHLLLQRLDGQARHRERARACLEALAARRLAGLAGACWGADLPYASRFTVATPATPNLFQTVNAAAAFLDAHEAEGEAGDLALATCVVDFVEHDLGRLEEDAGHVSWRYYPGREVLVYNVNASLAAFLCRLARCTGRGELAVLAGRTMAGVVAAQNADGSWYYAREPRGRWVDGFHTGYVLEGLLEYRRMEEDAAAQGALERGLAFYRQRLLEPTGLPRYTDRALYPIDVQSCAEAVQLLSKLAVSQPGMLPLAERAWAESAARLLVWGGPAAAPRAHLRLQRGRFLQCALASVRWGQAPMLLALAWLSTARRAQEARGPAPGGAFTNEERSFGS